MDGIDKFLKLVESESKEDYARYEYNDRVDTVGREMFKDETVSLDALELPFEKNDPFLSFDPNDVDGKQPLEMMANSLAKMGEFERLEKAGDFGVSQEVADMIDKLTDKIVDLGYDDKVTTEYYAKYVDAVVNLISRSPNSFEDWVAANEDQVSAAIDDQDEYNRDPYGYYGHKPSDF